MSSMCRVCLDGNTTLHSLENNLLVDVFEKLSYTKFNSADARPRAVCCYCRQKLLRCHTFSQMVHRSENIFTHIYDQGLEATHENISKINIGMKQQFSVATVQYFSVDSEYEKTNEEGTCTQVSVKHEPLPSVDIKEEVPTEQDQLEEAESAPENCTRSLFTFEEDSSDLGNAVEELPSTVQLEQTKRDTEIKEVLKIPLMSVDIKEEVPTDQLEEAESVPENCTRSRFTFEEDSSDLENAVEELPSTVQLEQTKRDTEIKEVLKIPLMSVDIKEEVPTDQLEEAESVPENCTRSLFTFEEDSSDLGNAVEELPSTIQLEQTKRDTEIKEVSKMPLKMPFTCDVCDKQFKLKCNLVRHMKTHTRKKLFACNVCDKHFNQKPHLVSHMKTHKGEKPFACSLCGKQFGVKKGLVSHMRLHTLEKPYACNQCDKQFYHRSSLVSHIRNHVTEIFFTCDVCDKHFSQKINLTCHMRSHTGEKPFACNVCDKQFSQKPYLVRHMKTHTGEKPFACSLCGKQFCVKKGLVSHMRTHTGEKPYACNQCDKQFYHSNSLVSHKRNHGQGNMISCDICNKQFNHISNLTYHMKTHTGDKQFGCNVCDKQFILKWTLVRHMQTHAGEKPFACSLCGKQFYDKKGLASHMRTHTLEKPFACNQCDKKYKQKQHLARHLKTHTGEKRFACSLCGKQFRLKSTLVSHMRTHTLEKPMLQSV